MNWVDRNIYNWDLTKNAHHRVRSAVVCALWARCYSAAHLKSYLIGKVLHVSLFTQIVNTLIRWRVHQCIEKVKEGPKVHPITVDVLRVKFRKWCKKCRMREWGEKHGNRRVIVIGSNKKRETACNWFEIEKKKPGEGRKDEIYRKNENSRIAVQTVLATNWWFHW